MVVCSRNTNVSSRLSCNSEQESFDAKHKLGEACEGTSLLYEGVTEAWGSFVTLCVAHPSHP